MVICLEQGINDLHMVQLMPLPPYRLCLIKIPISLTFVVPAYPGCPGKKAVKRVSVCLAENDDIHSTFLWSPYVIGQTIIFLPCGFYLLSFFPRLISAVGDWMSTILPHMVWP